MQWGVNNEQEALKAFTVLTGKTVQETGIWLDASGIFGDSPDGIVDDETVVEAKCPYTERNLTIEEAIATSPTFCLKKAQDMSQRRTMSIGSCLLGHIFPEIVIGGNCKFTSAAHH